MHVFFLHVSEGEGSLWQNGTGCDVTCGNETWKHTRACDKPPPVNGDSCCEMSANSSKSANANGDIVLYTFKYYFLTNVMFIIHRLADIVLHIPFL